MWDPPVPQNQQRKNPQPNKWAAKKKLEMQKPITGPPRQTPNYGAGYAPNIKNVGPMVKKAPVN